MHPRSRLAKVTSRRPSSVHTAWVVVEWVLELEVPSWWFPRRSRRDVFAVLRVLCVFVVYVDVRGSALEAGLEEREGALDGFAGAGRVVRSHVEVEPVVALGMREQLEREVLRERLGQ